MLAALGGSAVASLAPAAEIHIPAPPPLIPEDYAEARKAFKTRLSQVGPSPDAPESLTPPKGAERIAYPSGDFNLSAWITPASGGAAKPALLFLHGGNVLGEGHWDLTLPYRKAGYIVMLPALRGENGQPGAYSGFYDENSDVLAAAEALAGMPGVDRSRLFLAGHSIGGTQTMLAALSSKLFRGATAFSGGANAWVFYARFPEMLCFDPNDTKEFEMRSAVCFAGSFKCPTRIFHGTEEKRLAGPSRMTADRARAAGLNVEATAIPGDHFSALPEEIRRSMLFFEQL